MNHKLPGEPDIEFHEDRIEKKNDSGGYFIRESQLRNLEGKLLTQIEAMGLASGQEVASKSLISQVVWGLLEPKYIWIDDEDLSSIGL